MVVYIEYVLISNFLITYLFLYLSNIILVNKCIKIRWVIASLFGSFCALLYPLISFNGIILLLLKVMCGFVIVCMAYSEKRLKNVFSFFCVFMLITAVYGGINLFVSYSIYGNFEKDVSVPCLSILICTSLITYLLRQLNIYIKNKQNLRSYIYDITIEDNNKSIRTKAYFDSGNVLLEPITKEPITVINYKLFFELNTSFSSLNLLNNKVGDLKKAHYVSIKSANGTSDMLVFCVDSVNIYYANKNIKFHNAWLGVSKTSFNALNCDALLNLNLLGAGNV